MIKKQNVKWKNVTKEHFDKFLELHDKEKIRCRTISFCTPPQKEFFYEGGCYPICAISLGWDISGETTNDGDFYEYMINENI
jgi:hypothetical protein